jgi:enediyne biosynthesis protein E4
MTTRHQILPSGRVLAACLAAVAALLSACKDEEKKQSEAQKPAEYSYAAPKSREAGAIPMPVFTDVTDEAGIKFTAVTGADGRKLMPETMGSGVGMLDFDGDGWLDLVMVNGRPWDKNGCPPLVTVYRNERNGKFKDVTAELGLDKLCGYGMGVAIADYDGDGRPDIFVTGVDGNRLLHNDGGSRFTDVTKAAGLQTLPAGEHEWSTSAAWLDADGDGRLDLFVANYVRWTPETDVFTTRDGVNKSYATPKVYEGASNRLFRNRGDGTFEDVSVEAGVHDEQNKGLGVVVLDINGDGAPDIFLANDTLPNKLYVNDGHGRFEDKALEYGVGYDETGRAKAGMGADAVDIGGVLTIAVGNFSEEGVSHYELAASGGTFADGGPRRGLAATTLNDLTFGARFADMNNDGLPDLVLANGHIEPDIAKVQAGIAYRQPPRLFLRDAAGLYHDYAQLSGKPLAPPMVGRALAIGDIDNDGALDLLISTNGGPVHLLRNDGPKRGWLEITLAGKGANRDALGAAITIEAEGGWRYHDTVRARGSYLASSPYTLHTGLPDGVSRVDISVVWPDGGKSIFKAASVDRHYRLAEEGGLSEFAIKKAGE